MKNENIIQRPLVSYRVIKHSMQILSLFKYQNQSLYQFDEVEYQNEIFPILLFVEGLIYEADYAIEAAQKETDNSLKETIQPWLERKEILCNFFQEVGLYNSEMELALDAVSDYALIESQLMRGHNLTEESLEKAINLRACDLVILHCICRQKTNTFLTAAEIQAINLFEIIKDFEFDLREYQDDLASGELNICTMAINIFGSRAEHFLKHKLQMQRSQLQNIVDQFTPEKQTLFKQIINQYFNRYPPEDVPDLLISDTVD